MTDASDEAVFRNSRPEKTYVSRQIEGLMGQKIRIAHKIIDGGEGHQFATIKDELVLRRTQAGRFQIKITFNEENRDFITFTIQKFTGKGAPKEYFSFGPGEVDLLLQFLTNVKRINFPDNGKMNIHDRDLEQFLLQPDQLRRVLTGNQNLLAAIARNEITSEDVVALAYRKKQLLVFKRLLEDTAYFDQLATNASKKPEGLWQRFFEKNPWILGYSLSLIHFGPLDDGKLEQTVSGHDLKGPGKRVDALLRSRAILSTTAFVELKQHRTNLTATDQYRPGIWAPSRELIGAVAQVQGTVAAALDRWSAAEKLHDRDGDPTGETLYTTEPRSFVICGSLDEFRTEEGTAERRFGCFERYRRNLLRPEIVTFDELYERASLIVHAGDPVSEKTNS